MNKQIGLRAGLVQAGVLLPLLGVLMGFPQCQPRDNDGDGWPKLLDCDDQNAVVYPNAPELCDGLDNNCDGVVDEGYDADADGIADCFDLEECDGLDNDGDGSVDEDFDSDYDGIADCFDVEECDGLDNDGNGEVDEGFDADFDDIADCFDVEECDGLDNDGNGKIDEGFDSDIDGIADCFDVEECDGLDNNGNGEVDEGFDSDADGIADCFDVEECDGLDNDGDGEVDEGFDSDADGIADCFDVEECDGLDNDGNGLVDEGFDSDEDGIADCFDAEDCDGLDNDGDGEIDEDFDADGDGVTSCGYQPECGVLFDLAHGEGTYSNPYLYETEHAWGFAADTLVTNGYTWDSNDSTPLTKDMLEAYDMLQIAEPLSDFSEAEIDAIMGYVYDGGGLLLITDFNEPYINPIALPLGAEFMGYSGLLGWVGVDDWDDTHPVTEGISSVFWAYGSQLTIHDPEVQVVGEYDDAPIYALRTFGNGRVVFSADNEVFAAYGYYQINDPDPEADRDNVQLWTQTVQWLTDCPETIPADCDDTDASVNPDAEEVCDGVDNNCDGAVDEGFDTDDDGIADCFDVEECDGLDNDGDGEIDEGFDADEDGIADCFDLETCDGLDNDGDGEIDEGFDVDGDGLADCTGARFCSAADGLNLLDGGAPAVATWDENERWTATIDEAIWIWDEYLETNPLGDEYHAIFRNFQIPAGATLTGATLEMAADNSYEVWLNGVSVGADNTEFNYFAPTDLWDLSSAAATGSNTLEFEIHNWALAGSTAYTNPGGLLYCVSLSYTF